MKEGTFSYRRLMFTTFIISGCSIIYELLISSVSSYLLGDSIAQFHHRPLYVRHGNGVLPFQICEDRAV